MTLARGILSIALATWYVLFALAVPIGAFTANRTLVLRNEDRHVSTTPIVGTVAGTLAVLVAPIGTAGDRLIWSWLPLGVEATLYLILRVLWNATGLRAKAEDQRREHRERR
jgi:hypothetical protein